MDRAGYRQELARTSTFYLPSSVIIMKKYCVLPTEDETETEIDCIRSNDSQRPYSGACFIHFFELLCISTINALLLLHSRSNNYIFRLILMYV